MEPTSTSSFSSHPSDSATLPSSHSTSSNLNKECQENRDPDHDPWAAYVGNKSKAPIIPGALKQSIHPAYAQTPQNLGESSNITGEESTSTSVHSFSELFSSKLGILDTGKTVSSAEEGEADENFRKARGSDSHGIGYFLPRDEEDLLAGVTDHLDSLIPSDLIDDRDDFDVFSSGGGMELEGEVPVPYYNNHRNADVWAGSPPMAGEHPYGEHPSRTLFVRNINCNIDDNELKMLFEQFGDIREFYSACKHRGFVMVSYYDIRAARSAIRSLQNKLICRRKLDIHFSIPKDNPSDRDINQGTLVVFNLDATVSSDDLRQIFGVYGEIKEIRETPQKWHHKFVEYYDVRAAEAALWGLNKTEIAGKRIKLEPSRPGGARRSLMQQLLQELDQDVVCPPRQQAEALVSHPGHISHWAAGHNIGDAPRSLHQIPVPLNLHSPMHVPPSVSAPHLPPPFRGTIGSIPPHFGQHNEVEGSSLGSPMKQHDFSPYHPNSLPEFGNCGFPSQYGNPPGSISFLRSRKEFEGRQHQIAATSGSADMLVFDHGMGVGGIPGDLPVPDDNCRLLPGQHALWQNPNNYLHHPQKCPPAGWPSTSSTSTYNHNDPHQLGHQPYPFSGMHGHIGDGHLSAHFAGSAPSRRPAGMDAYNGSFTNSPNSSPLIRYGSLGGMGGLDPCATHAQASHGMMDFGPIMPNPIDIRSSSACHGFLSPQQRPHFTSKGGLPIPYMSPPDAWYERGRNRRGDSSLSQAENRKQYQLDLDRILRGEDHRTTLMIKNIPNKYTVNMLLVTIDEHHRGTYDFIYLPIDFKNKCNVGYAFINMVDPLSIIPFCEAFNGKKWEKFNSEKVASLAYARIQGKAALIAHFQNSSLMNEDKRCRPLIFHTEGPNMGDQEPFPLGINVSTQTSKEGNDGIPQPGSPAGTSSSKDEGLLEGENPEPITDTKNLEDEK